MISRTPTEWIRRMLESREIHAPDGRPLYQYRLSDDEYADLGSLIKLTARFGVAHITSMLSWDAIFVFYASEWWRREFSGRWGWSEVFQAVDIDFTELA